MDILMLIDLDKKEQTLIWQRYFMKTTVKSERTFLSGMTKYFKHKQFFVIF